MSDEPVDDELWNSVRYFRIGDRDVPMYVDRAGEPISLGRWSDLRQDPAYRTVGQDTVGTYEVRTLWMGTVSDPFETPGLIFGTGIFHDGRMISEIETATEADAQKCHQDSVRELRERHDDLSRSSD